MNMDRLSFVLIVCLVTCALSCSDQIDEPMTQSGDKLDSLTIVLDDLRMQVARLDSTCLALSRSIERLTANYKALEENSRSNADQVSHLRANLLQMTFRLDDLETTIRYLQSQQGQRP